MRRRKPRFARDPRDPEAAAGSALRRGRRTRRCPFGAGAASLPAQRADARLRAALTDSLRDDPVSGGTSGNPVHPELLETGRALLRPRLLVRQLPGLLRPDHLFEVARHIHRHFFLRSHRHRAARLSDGLLPCLSHRAGKDHVAHPDYRPLLDQLPTPGVRLEDNSRLSGGDQLRSHEHRPHIGTPAVSPVQPFLGRGDLDARVGGFRHSSHIRVASCICRSFLFPCFRSTIRSMWLFL